MNEDSIFNLLKTQPWTLQREILLEILCNKLTQDELRRLTMLLFENPNESEKLGNSHDDRSMNLYTRVSGENKLDQLLHKLIRHYFDKVHDLLNSRYQYLLNAILQKQDVGQSTESEPQDKAQQQPFLRFTNRESELDEAIYNPRGQYLYFQAPTGYGKTRLLGEINENLQARGWIRVLLTVQPDLRSTNIIPTIVEQLSQQLPDPEQTLQACSKGTLIESSEAIGRWLAAVRTSKLKIFQGVAILVDIPNGTVSHADMMTRAIIENVITGIWVGLEDADYFKRVRHGYRVIVTGRSEGKYFANLSYPQFERKVLKPLEYKHVKRICEEIVQDLSAHVEFAANLFFISGGHPGCISQILKEFYTRNPQNPRAFFDTFGHTLQHIMSREAHEVSLGIEANLRGRYRTLCIYRRLNDVLLETHLQDHPTYNVYSLRQHLLAASLVEWDDIHRTYAGDVVRRLMALRLRYEEPPEFKEACAQAQERYLKEMQGGGELCALWAVEAWFQFFQKEFERITTTAERKQLEEEFLTIQVPEVLKRLVDGRSNPASDLESLRGIVHNDWEFKFTVNYYLRDEAVDRSSWMDPFNKLIALIEKFQYIAKE